MKEREKKNHVFRRASWREHSLRATRLSCDGRPARLYYSLSFSADPHLYPHATLLTDRAPSSIINIPVALHQTYYTGKEGKLREEGERARAGPSLLIPDMLVRALAMVSVTLFPPRLEEGLFKAFQYADHEYHH